MGMHTRARVMRRYMMVGEEVTRDNAYREVRKAIRTGVLVPHPCEVCGGPSRTEAHHANGYAQALDVTWLCVTHHQQAHRIMREAKPVAWRSPDGLSFTFHSRSRPSHLLATAVRVIEFLAERGAQPELKMLAARLDELTDGEAA